MLKIQKTIDLPAAGPLGFETPLGEEENAIQATVHRFAAEVMRPAARELDRMSAEEVIAPGSPFYQVLHAANSLGLDPAALEQLPPEMAVRIEAIIGEELGWGDAGLAVSLGVAGLPALVAATTGERELIEMCTGRIGCWMNTQPDRGSDAGILYPEEVARGGKQAIGNVTAKVGKDEVVINGQSSAWISNGTVAQVGMCYMAADYGHGFYEDEGRGTTTNGIALLIPLDLPGISRGKPLEKIGQRSLPQGEIYFDNVRVPKRFVVATHREAWAHLASVWSFGGMHMSLTFTGVARAAFEMALAYCHERRQGGALLIEHQMTQLRIGEMMRRVEMARATTRRALSFARHSPLPHPYVSAQSKVSVTDEAFKVVNEAMQLFGGNGTTLEYPIEKLFRDTRSALIEDGENNILSCRMGVLASRLFREGWAQN